MTEYIVTALEFLALIPSGRTETPIFFPDRRVRVLGGVRDSGSVTIAWNLPIPSCCVAVEQIFHVGRVDTTVKFSFRSRSSSSNSNEDAYCDEEVISAHQLAHAQVKKVALASL